MFTGTPEACWGWAGGINNPLTNVSLHFQVSVGGRKHGGGSAVFRITGQGARGLGDDLLLGSQAWQGTGSQAEVTGTRGLLALGSEVSGHCSSASSLSFFKCSGCLACPGRGGVLPVWWARVRLTQSRPGNSPVFLLG